MKEIYYFSPSVFPFFFILEPFFAFDLREAIKVDTSFKFWAKVLRRLNLSFGDATELIGRLIAHIIEAI
jgi:hypothetical protein